MKRSAFWIGTLWHQLFHNFPFYSLKPQSKSFGFSSTFVIYNLLTATQVQTRCLLIESVTWSLPLTRRKELILTECWRDWRQTRHSPHVLPLQLWEADSHTSHTRGVMGPDRLSHSSALQGKTGRVGSVWLQSHSSSHCPLGLMCPRAVPSPEFLRMLSEYVTLEEVLENFSCKSSDRKYSGFVAYMVSVIITQFCGCSTKQPYRVYKWTWLCSNKYLFFKKGSGPDLAQPEFVVCLYLVFYKILTWASSCYTSWA